MVPPPLKKRCRWMGCCASGSSSPQKGHGCMRCGHTGACASASLNVMHAPHAPQLHGRRAHWLSCWAIARRATFSLQYRHGTSTASHALVCLQCGARHQGATGWARLGCASVGCQAAPPPGAVRACHTALALRHVLSEAAHIPRPGATGASHGQRRDVLRSVLVVGRLRDVCVAALAPP